MNAIRKDIQNTSVSAEIQWKRLTPSQTGMPVRCSLYGMSLCPNPTNCDGYHREGCELWKHMSSK